MRSGDASAICPATSPSVEWLKYLSPFYYYQGHDPLGAGVDVGDLVVLAAGTIVLTIAAVLAFERRDLRA